MLLGTGPVAAVLQRKRLQVPFLGGDGKPMASLEWTGVHLVALSAAIQQGGWRERAGLVDRGGNRQVLLRQH